MRLLIDPHDALARPSFLSQWLVTRIAECCSLRYNMDIRRRASPLEWPHSWGHSEMDWRCRRRRVDAG